ncbi:MAG: hypothetical protein IPK96_06315 [Flammeovirgaceae bacterium]|jgi:hypothetical protein|nr:hypothetical protein [Flammeovirgaceae bacterium]MBL7874625.1 hypothetical protein [Cyclobacteriaceae bacterium]
MKTTSKVAIGLGVAGGALLAAWLLTGDRKNKTKEFVTKKANDLKQALKKEVKDLEDSESLYV